MQPRRIYLALTAVGVVLPLFELAPWIAAHGLQPVLFAHELFANRVSGFFAMDVIVSAVVVISLARRERGAMRFWWFPVLATLLIGVSAGLPLLLYLRAAPARHPEEQGGA